ncbi:hypothetical protein [Frateuria aurantia]|uniref:hypothetical protein n=1 Tax=Frateuria aurantia TaxID=81475 RepID=UPI0012EA3A38|nr:hypothetical protein [Frateuria aurantia]
MSSLAANAPHRVSKPRHTGASHASRLTIFHPGGGQSSGQFDISGNLDHLCNRSDHETGHSGTDLCNMSDAPRDTTFGAPAFETNQHERPEKLRRAFLQARQCQSVCRAGAAGWCGLVPTPHRSHGPTSRDKASKTPSHPKPSSPGVPWKEMKTSATI